MPVKTKKKQSKPIGTKFQSIMLISIYRYAKLGMPETAIADAVDVSASTFKYWKKLHPSIQQAIDMGRTDSKDGGNWHKFVYDRLPQEVRALWDKICEWDELPNGIAKIEALLSDHGKSIRQQLFLYALIQSNFSWSRACAKVNIDKDTMDYWIQNDVGFADLVEEIQWHKGNFFEEHLVSLVRTGDTAATIFANRTFNKDRGYAVKNELDIRHSGTVEHSLDLTELVPFLTQEVQAAILEAIRLRDKQLRDSEYQESLPVEAKVLRDLSEEIASPQETT